MKNGLKELKGKFYGLFFLLRIKKQFKYYGIQKSSSSRQGLSPNPHSFNMFKI